MKTKHTAGPWIHIPEDNIILACDGRLILQWQPRSIDVFVEDRDANGRLCAAAPDLLEALIPFAKFACKEGHFNEPECFNCKALKAVEKAIGGKLNEHV